MEKVFKYFGKLIKKFSMRLVQCLDETTLQTFSHFLAKSQKLETLYYEYIYFRIVGI